MLLCTLVPRRSSLSLLCQPLPLFTSVKGEKVWSNSDTKSVRTCMYTPCCTLQPNQSAWLCPRLSCMISCSIVKLQGMASESTSSYEWRYKMSEVRNRRLFRLSRWPGCKESCMAVRNIKHNSSELLASLYGPDVFLSFPIATGYGQIKCSALLLLWALTLVSKIIVTRYYMLLHVIGRQSVD